MKEYICVFDCETIPDITALERTLPSEIAENSKENSVINPLVLSQKALELQESKTGSSFLPINFHQIICISAVICENSGKIIKVNDIEGENEREMIGNFLNFIEKFSPRLISYNGRGFDLPLIMLRAMKYNFSCSKYFNYSDKWCNYRSRYDGVWALDLLDHISDFKAVSGLKLDTLCATLGMPGKYDIHGDQVLELYYQNKLGIIKEYCQSDALNTYWLFLKYELLRARITHGAYLECLSALREHLINHCAKMSYKEPFCACLDAELAGFKSQSPAKKDGEITYEYC